MIERILTRGEALPEKNNGNNINIEADSNSGKDRKKRVQRIKTGIVIIVVILLILPTICCIILGIQVNRLQNQVNDLLRLHNEYGLKNSSLDGGVYALAAEKDELEVDDRHRHSEDTIEKIDVSTTKEDNPEQTAADVKSEGSISGLANNELQDAVKIDTVVEETSSDKGNDQLERHPEKKVYLTFDDGPSIYTDDILDILAEYKVKATFFVVGMTDSHSKKLYQRIVDEGHTLGMHSYSHRYSQIYNSVEDFEKDFTKLWKLLYDTTGYKPSIFRFPGGSDNMVNKNGMEDFIRYLNDSDIVYFDWNVLNGDATGVKYTKEQLIENVLDGVATKNKSIVLLHDAQTKQTTVESLPGLLDKLISEGVQILPLDKEVTPIQMIKADTIK